MNQLMRQTKVARRRLVLELFLHSLARCWLIAFAVAVIPLAIPKLWALPVDLTLWNVGWIGAATMVGLVAATVYTLMNRPSFIQAATEIDLRLKLRERLSSALQLREEEKSSAIGQALMRDAEWTAGRLDVRDSFAVKFSRQQWAFLIPFLLAVGTLFLPDATPAVTVHEGLDATTLTQVKNTAQDLLSMIQKQREDAEQKDLEEAVDFFKQLEKKAQDLRKSTSTDPKKILSDINQLKESLERRKEELGSSEALKKNLAALKSLEQGPAAKMANAIEEGDFDEAAEEMQKMLEDLESGNMTSEKQKELAAQMGAMAEALAQAASAHEEAKRELEKQIAAAEQAGNAEKVAELREQLDQRQAQDASMAEMARMAEQMQAAKESLERGDRQGAKEALEKMRQQLEQMDAEDKQLKSLQELMEGANECKKCANGQCDGDVAGEGKGMGNKAGNGMGMGLGQGNGEGERPEEETATKHIDSQVRTEMGKGETVYAGKAGGANRKGTSREEVREAILAAEAEDAKALEHIPLTKKARDQAREYFDSLRDGR